MEPENPDIFFIDKLGEVNALKQGTAIVSLYSWDDAFPVSANEPVFYRTDGIHASKNIIVE